MAHVEGREAALAGDAIAVLREERIEPLSADAACIVNRLGERIRVDDTESLAETSGDFQRERVVYAVAAIVNQLDDAVIEVREARRNRRGGPVAQVTVGDGLVRVLETIEMMA